MSGSVKRNFSRLLFGNISVQVISLGFYPFITRLYSPLEFGVFGIFNSIVQIASIYSFGQIHSAMLVISDEGEKNEIFTLAIGLNALTSILLFFPLLGGYLNGKIDFVYLALPLAVFAYGMMEINKTWAVAHDHLGSKSVIINLSRILSNAFKLLGTKATILIASEILSNLFGAMLFLFKSGKSVQPGRTLKQSRNILKKYKDFPIYYTFYTLAQVLSVEALTLYLPPHLKESEVGIFFLGNKLFVQTALVVSSTLTFSFSRKLVRESSSRLPVYRSLLKVCLLGLAVAILLALPDYREVVGLFFGQKWIELSSVMNYFIFLAPLKIFVGFFAYLIMLSDNIKFISIFKFTQFVLLLLLLQTGFSDLKEFLRLFVPYEVFCDSVFIFSGYYLTKRSS